MKSAAASRVLSIDEAAAYRPEQVVQLSRELAAARHQLDWFKRQVFGQKSERRLIDGADGQMSLGEALTQEPTVAPPAPAERQVAAHTRRATTRKPEADDDSLPFFDEARVPVEVIELSAPEAAGLAPDQFEVIGHKESFRLAQRPGSTVVLNYRRPVIKLKESQAIVCAAATVGVIEGSRADASFIAGLLIDKFAYHLPFYRQHQRLSDNGISVSRPWLTQLGSQAIALLEPIYDAQFDSIRASRVKAMDETPIKAGRAGPGKLKAAYFWPVYGERDEICFPFFDSRRIEHVEQALGLTPVERGVLLTDGYSARPASGARGWHSSRAVAMPAVDAPGAQRCIHDLRLECITVLPPHAPGQQRPIGASHVTWWTLSFPAIARAYRRVRRLLTALKMSIRELAHTLAHNGYRRVRFLLRRKGHPENVKRYRNPR